jgi:uncharacterized protein
MSMHSYDLPQDFLIIDVHVHLGTYEERYIFPPFYIEALCNRFPVERFIWAPFSWDESYHHLNSAEAPSFSAQIINRAMRWLWISPIREGGLSLLIEDKCPSGYVGIKLHPYADNYDLTIPLLNSVIEAAERWQVPVAIHTGNRGCSPKSIERCFPKSFSCPLLLFHSRPFQESVAVARQLPSVYLELSFSSPKNLCQAFEEIGPERIIFGSDYPTAAIYYKGFDVLEFYHQNLLEFIEVSERYGITKQFFNENARKIFSKHALQILS